MPATTVSITCDVSLPTALEFTSATFKFQLSEPDYDTTDNEVIATTEITAVANASGVATVSLWPVTRGTRNSFYRVSLSAAVVVGGVPKWQDYTLGTIRPPATGAPHELADLLAQSSGGILVGSTIYATLADAVAAAVAAVADAEAEVALAAAQVALASAQADRASDEADRAIADGAAQVALATAQANRAEDEADRAVDNAAAQVALASAQADRAEAAAAGYESLGNAIALAEAEVARAATEADRAELAADGVASLEAQAAASAAAAAVSAGIAVAAVESTTSEGATWRPEYYGATGVGNDTAALAAWLASGGPLHVIKGKTYQFNAALTFPAGVKISGHLNLIWTGIGSVPIATINDDVSIDDLTISCPTTTGNGVTIGRNYKGRSIVINGFGNSGAGAVTISDPEGLDLDLFESTGGFQRPLTLGNGLVWSVGGRIGMVRVRDYTRGIGMNYLDGFILEGYDIQGRNALASFTAGHNGIIAAGLRNCRFGPGIIANAGEHLFRLGGTAEMGESYNNTFGDMTLEAPGGCYIKLNANAIAYDFRFGNINAVGRFASVPGGNREFLRLSHCRDLTFGVCRLVVGDGFAYSAQDALALNDIDGVYVQSLHVEGLGQSVVDYASGQDIGEGLGNGDVRNVSIGALTGTDLTNRTMVRFAMAAGFEAGSLTISSSDYFSDGPLFSANGTTVVDAPCSISGRVRKTDLSTLPAVTNLPANMAVNLMIGEATAVSRDAALVFTGPDVDFPVQAPLAAMLVDENDRTLLGVNAQGEMVSATPTGVAVHRHADAGNLWQNTGWPEYYYTDGLRLPQDIARRAIIIPGYGQSLAGAANDNPTDTLTNAVATYPDHAFMPAVGPSPDGFYFDSVRPLVDIAGSGFNTRRAHWLSPMANGIIAAMDTAFSVRPKIITFSASQGGRAYNDLMPGNEAFRYLAKGIQGSCIAARKMGLIPWVPAIFWVQGEQNRAEGVSEERIRRDLQAMGREVTALVRGMTGQPDDPIIFISQPNNSLEDNGIIPPHMTVPVSMDGIANMRVLPPHYNLGMSSDGVANTGVHPDSAGYQVMGARFATVFNEEIFGRGYTAIKCVQAFWETSSIIRLKYQTRGGDLVIDTSGAVVAVPAWAGSLNGWQFFDGSGSPPTISSMTVVDDPDTTGTSLTVLRIVLSAAPTGNFPRLHYATRNDGTGANSGRLTGPRGCLRDSVQTTFWANSQVIYLGKP